MPSAEQQTVLLQGAAAWNRWRRETPASVALNLDDLRLTLCAKQWSATNGEPIDLSQASLRRADFCYATLERADLRGADLREANFRNARLNGANFAKARLAGAHFAQADLAGALLEAADVRGANFSEARNVTCQQLRDTVGDATTVLPEGMPRPDAWKKQRPETGEAEPQNHAPTTRRRTRNVLAVCATLVVALGLISAVVVDPAAPSRAAPRGHNAAQGSTAHAVVPRSPAMMQTSPPLTAVARRRTLAHPPSPAMAPKLATRTAVSNHSISQRDQVQLRQVAVLALRDDGPPEASRPLEAAPLATIKPDAVAVAVASSPPEVINRYAADASLHLREGATPPAGAPVQHREEVLALRDRGPLAATRLFDAALPTSEPAVGVVAAAQAPAKVIARDVPVDTNLPLPRAGAPDDPLLAYLTAPERSDRWIGGLVERFYLSGMALNGPRVLSVYAAKVDYFGLPTPATEVARQKASYYARWPRRSYALIPGSFAVKWKTADRAEVVFSYRYRVAARKAHTAGRGRAILEIDFSQRAARIAKEDGKLLSAPRG